MIMYRFFTICFVFIISFNAFSKKDEIEVKPAVFDFGEIYNWDNPPAVFEIINNTQDQLRFLPTFPTENFMVKLPRTPVLPGKSAKVEVFYYTNQLGSFTQKVDVYTGNSTKAIELKIKGEIVSFSPSAHMACPTINKDRPVVQEFYQEVKIVDASTGESIENAEIKWFLNNKTAHKSITSKNGKAVEQVVMGNYSLLATKDGYEPNTANGLISRSSGMVVIPLKPIEVQLSASNYPVQNNTKPEYLQSEKSQVEESIEREHKEVNNQEDKVEKPVAQIEEAIEESTPNQYRADFSHIESEKVDLEFYENDKSYERDQSDTEKEYLERIEALKKQEENEKENAWKSPFDKQAESGKSAESVETVTENESANENAENIPLEFYNRDREPENPDKDMDNAAYLAYLEELRKLDGKKDDEYEKPNFFPWDDDSETKTEKSNSRETTNVITANKSNTDIVNQKEQSLDPEFYAANNILFLLDVSSSMKGEDKMGLLKVAINNLIDVLRDFDYLTVMTYSSETNILFKHNKVENKEQLKDLVNSLEASGWTFGLKGLGNAFEIIKEQYINSGNNQIIISTDGKFNNPTFTEKDLYSLVREYNSSTKLSVIGFGDDQDAIKRMGKLAKVGNGNFLYINNKREAGDILVKEIKEQSLLDQ